MKRAPIAPFLLFFLLVLADSRLAAQQPKAQSFEQLFTRAVELQQAGDLLGAIDTYKAALTIVPGNADALSNLGAAYVRLGQYAEAIAQYEAALKTEPLNHVVRLNLALAFYKSARPNDAIPQLRRVLAASPESPNAYLILADCYLQTGQEQEVVTLLQPREQMFGADLAYAYLLGTALLHAGNSRDGQKYVDRIFGAGDSAEARLLMGIAHLGSKDFPAAKIELERAVKLNPKLPTAHSLYGRSLLALGEAEAAERAFRRELEVNINDYEANLQLGHLRRGNQRFDEASVYLERALGIRPRDLTARKLLADLRLQTGKTEEAVQMLETIAEEAPDLVEVHVQLATGYNRLKRTEDARRHKEIVDRLNADAAAKQRGKGSRP